MLDILKSLLVVLSIAWVVFAIARPICLRFMAEEDFVRRRNVWAVLTVAGLVSPNIWLFALVAMPILVWGGGRESNVVALYLLLMHVVPPIGKQIPSVIINQIFELNFYRVMAFALLAPAAWRLVGAKAKAKPSGLALVDGLVLAYLALSLALGMPYESFTNTLRRAFLMGLDVWLLYFVITRSCTSRERIVEALSSVALACALMAPVALVESLTTWLAYRPISYRWDIEGSVAMLMRGDTLRAQASAGHALALGYVMAMGLICWLHVRYHLGSKWRGFVGAALMWVGLLATLSRGPALAAILGYFAYMVLGRHGSVRLVRAAFSASLVVGAVYVSPFWDDLMELLPFVGSVDAENVTYRQRLAEYSWMLIKENPFLGDPFFLNNMEEMRQGGGIIDLVNVYAAVALQSGIVGLLLLLGPFAVGMWRAFKLVKLSAATEPAFADLGASLLAAMLTTLFMFVVGSFGTSLAKMYYVLAALAASYACIGAAGHARSVSGAEDRAALRRPPPHSGPGGTGAAPAPVRAHR